MLVDIQRQVTILVQTRYIAQCLTNTGCPVVKPFIERFSSFSVLPTNEMVQFEGQSALLNRGSPSPPLTRTRGESICQLQRLHHQIRAPRLGGKVCVCVLVHVGVCACLYDDDGYSSYNYK